LKRHDAIYSMVVEAGEQKNRPKPVLK